MPVAVRLCALFVGLALAACVFVPAFHVAASPDASLAPPFSDFGLDSDGDGLYEALVIVVPVSVQYEGDYTIEAWIDEFARMNVTTLSAGLHNVWVALPGALLYARGLDGPYTATITLFELIGLESATYVTAGYSYLSFERPAARFAGVSAEAPVDADGDGLYDVLQIDVAVDVAAAGDFEVSGFLEDARGFFVDGGNPGPRTLSPGTHTWTFRFIGVLLNASRMDGPYNATFFLFQGPSYDTLNVDRLTYWTAAYRGSQFNGPIATLSGPLTEAAEDIDGDGLFDRIVISTTLDVNRPGEVRIEGSLLASGYVGLGQWDTPLHFVSPGATTLDLAFSTMVFRSYRMDGPYNASVWLRMSGVQGYVGNATLETRPYSWTQLRPESATIDSASITSALPDTDGDGRADFLHLDVPLDVRRSGDYFLQDSFGFGPYLASGRLVHLEPGRRTVGLDLSGIALNRSWWGSPLRLGLWLSRLDGEPNDFNQTLWTASGLRGDLFTGLPVRYLNVSARWANGGPAHSGRTILADPSRGFVQEHYLSNEDGTATFYAYPGTFVLAIAETWPLSIPEVRSVELTADTNLNLTLRPGFPDSVSWSLSMVSWNETAVTGTWTMAQESAILRMEADRLGDFDGVASPSELDLLVRYKRPDGIAPDEYSLQLSVDDRTQPLATSAFRSGTGAGDLLATGPVTGTWEYVLRDSEPSPPGTRHNVTLNVTYDGGWYQYAVRLGLPPGAAGNVTVSGNVSVRNRGAGIWDIDPGRPPHLGEAFASVRIETFEAVPGPADATLPWVLGLVGGSVAATGLAAYVLLRRKRKAGG